ncbi:EAL domain-containing protein [Rickettsiales bacterium]|nr:EAL domain-containing protein [Rickettsiales bacterium]
MKIVTKDTESKLVDIVSNLQEAPDGYYAIHFHLSKLQEQYRSTYQIRIAVNILSDLFKREESVIFVTEDKDIFVLYRGSERSLLEKSIFQIRYLFMDDTLAYNDDGFENENFCSVYDLEFQWRDFYNSCKRKATGRSGKAIEPENEEISSMPKKNIQTFSGKRGKMHILTPDYLVEVLKEVEDMDVSGAFRSQYVCALKEGRPLQPLFKETYVSIKSLQDMLDVNVDLLSSKTLFKYFTKTLDRKVLHLFEQGVEGHIEPPVSLNLNLKTLLSDEFATFDKLIKNKDKQSVVIEINTADVFEDVDTFLLAKDAVQKLGYRICLDGLDGITFPQINRKELGFDLAKLKWNPELIEKSCSKRNELITKAVKECGANRIILCRCDNQDAVDYGRAMGISLFQGWYIDELLDAKKSG